MGKHAVKIGIIGGSGLDDVAKRLLVSDSNEEDHNCDTIFGPIQPVTFGSIEGIPVVLLSRHGKGHKISPSHVNYRGNIEKLKSLGCTHILATTACGSLKESIKPGEFVVPDNFIDRTFLRKVTLYDSSTKEYSGVCHIPMEPAFHPRTSRLLYEAGKELNKSVKLGGTIVTIEGPRFSSKAESKLMQQMGGDLVNMTTCPEVYLAKEAGILYASMAMATDYDCWRDSGEPVCVANVMKVFMQTVDNIGPILVKAVQLIGQQDWDEDIDNLREIIKSGNMSPK